MGGMSTGMLVALIVGGASAVGSIAMGIAGATSQPTAPSIDTAASDTAAAQQAQAAAQAQATALEKRRGMASTILTSPMGVTTQPQTMRATLGA